MLTHEIISNAVNKAALLHPMKRAYYFGSYADGRATATSDLDLLVEFHQPRVSLFVLSAIKLDLEDQLKVPVDVIHAPLPDDSILEIDKVVQVYG